MTTLKVRRLRRDAVMPTYAHSAQEEAGMDLVAVEHEEIWPGERAAVATGIAVELDPGFELQIRPRSGVALKHGVTVLNTPGTIDPSYRGEIKVILVNHGNRLYRIAPGDRIAQAVLARYEMAAVVEVEELSATARGAGGFGSSGV